MLIVFFCFIEGCLGLSHPLAPRPFTAKVLNVKFKSIAVNIHSYKISWKPVVNGENFSCLWLEMKQDVVEGGGGGTHEIEWDYNRFKEGMKEGKLFSKHHQTVDPHERVL